MRLLKVVLGVLVLGMSWTLAWANPVRGPVTIRDYFLADEASEDQFSLSAYLGVHHLVHSEVGLKGSFVVADQGFIDSLSDSVSVELGYYFRKGLWYRAHAVSGSMRWDFHLLPDWTVFGAPGLDIATVDYTYDYSESQTEFMVEALIGTYYKLNDVVAIRGEYDLFDVSLRGGLMVTF